MKHIIHSIFISLLFILVCCQKKHTEPQPSAQYDHNPTDMADENQNIEEEALIPEYCKVPNSIVEFVQARPEQFVFLSNDDLKLIKPFASDCPLTLQEDFTGNGSQDFAIIVKNKTYQSNSAPNHQFPFLLIFNDYQSSEQLNPRIIVKTGDYKNDDIQTVIYDQFDQGIFSYLKPHRDCNQNMIEINIPEKSSFLLYWNKGAQNYEYINSLDFKCPQARAQVINRKPSVYIDGNDLVVNTQNYQKVIPNIVQGGMSISPSITPLNDDSFYLTLLNTGSINKVQIAYLVSTDITPKVQRKEYISLGPDGAKFYRVNIDQLPLENQESIRTLEDMNLENELTFAQASTKGIQTVYDQFKNNVDKINYSQSFEELFISFPDGLQ